MWQELEDKKAVVDYDIDSRKYLTKKYDDYKKQLEQLTPKLWDNVHIKIYRGEYLPKQNKSDGYVELLFPGVIDSRFLFSFNLLFSTFYFLFSIFYFLFSIFYFLFNSLLSFFVFLFN